MYISTRGVGKVDRLEVIDAPRDRLVRIAIFVSWETGSIRMT